jgi:hypothetical protein
MNRLTQKQALGLASLRVAQTVEAGHIENQSYLERP